MNGDILWPSRHSRVKVIDKPHKRKVMKQEFSSQEAAIQWISQNARNEAHREILQMELDFNYIFSGYFFIDLLEVTYAVAMGR